MHLALELFEVLSICFFLNVMDDITEISFVGKYFFDVFYLITDGRNISPHTLYSIAILLYLRLYCL